MNKIQVGILFLLVTGLLCIAGFLIFTTPQQIEKFTVPAPTASVAVAVAEPEPEPASVVETQPVEAAAPPVQATEEIRPIELFSLEEIQTKTEKEIKKITRNPYLDETRQDLIYYLPTENRALLEDNLPGYFMYCDRFFEGVASRPWQAGRFGFVRTAFRIHNGDIWYSKLHEGIDISPMRRDANGNALDPVHPIAKGVVVHTNPVSGRSNYGRYVVLSHDLPEGIFYSLYAHLADVQCEIGQTLELTDTIGTLGYSGVGLNQQRSHVHVEFCFMINSAYQDFAPASNYHGNYNGLNMIGMNVEDLLVQSRETKAISISEYLKTQKELYRIRVPNSPQIDFIKRYPFLFRGSEDEMTAPSLDISFTAEGIPLAIVPAEEELSRPKVLSSVPLPTLLQNCTSNRLKNNSQDPQLTANGYTFIQIFTNTVK